MEIAWISEFGIGEQVLRAVRGRLGDTVLQAGSATDLSASYCTRVMSGTLPPVIPNARADPRTRDLPITSELGIGSYVGAALRDRDGLAVGMLCCLSSSPTPELAAAEGRFLQLLADLLGSDILQWMATDGPARQRTRAQVYRLIFSRAIDIVFQPVLDLGAGTVAGYEALARFDPAYGTPGRLFTDAAAVGLGVQLEMLAIERAFERLDDIPAGAWLSINVSPATLLSDDFRELLRAPRGRPIVVELTEHLEIDDYTPVLERIDELRRHQVKIAVDDAGAGYSSLQHILHLRPDIIKIDIAIVRDLHTDPVRQALAHSLVSFAGSIGAELLAEGVEQQGELDLVSRIGVELAQGYLIAKPGQLPGPVTLPGVSRNGRRVDVVDALGGIVSAISAATDEQTLVRPLLDMVLDITGLESAYLAAVDNDRGTIEVRYSRNAGSLFVPEGQVRPWVGSLCHECLTHDTVWSADVPVELTGADRAAAEGIRTFLSVPIRDGNRKLIGSVAGASSRPLFLGESDLLAVRMLAYLVGNGGAPLRQPVPLESYPPVEPRTP